MWWLLCMSVVHAACIWPSPARLFPEELVYMDVSEMDDMGTRRYSILFDSSKSVPTLSYRIRSVEPSSLSYVSDVEHFRIDVSHEASLEWVDTVSVSVSVSSPCLMGHELGYSRYDLDIQSSYLLYHRYNNTLSPTNESVWTTRGWRTPSTLVLNPIDTDTYVVGREYVDGPCRGAWIESELRIENASLFTNWDNPDGAFVGPSLTFPRCHRPELGSVCVVHARTRLTWPSGCLHNVSVWQAVSQVSRMSPAPVETLYPSDFDVSRRNPVPDGDDLRYDVCKSRACTGNCTSSHVENDVLASDGDITIRQQQRVETAWVETVCEFEVVGFLDNIWSPHIYMRKWYGYEWY